MGFFLFIFYFLENALLSLVPTACDISSLSLCRDLLDIGSCRFCEISSCSLLAKYSYFTVILQAEQSKEEQKRGLTAEKLMRKASKDVCRLREQSQKVPLQVQSFR